MKTLIDTINDIKNANTSKAAKKRALIDLGLMPYEVNIVMAGINAATPARPRVTFTFGVEIECDVQRGAIAAAAPHHAFNYQYEGYNHRDGQAHFKFVSDSSVRGHDPIECVSPILTGKNGFNALKACCDTLDEAGATVNRSCGLHVHIGVKNITNQQYCNTFVNYMYLEDLIDTFMAPSRRADSCQWCDTLKNHRNSLEAASNPRDIQSALGYDRYHKVNAESFSRHHTIEFRQHAGSTNYAKISNWASFCGKLVCWSKNHRLTNPITNIDDLEFLTAAEKAYFKTRQAEFATR